MNSDLDNNVKNNNKLKTHGGLGGHPDYPDSIFPSSRRFYPYLERSCAEIIISDNLGN